MPRPLDWGPLDDLPPHLVAVLLEVLLHKAASADKLARVTGGTSAELRAALGELLAMGLVVQNRRQIAAIDPAVYEPLIAWLGKRELA